MVPCVLQLRSLKSNDVKEIKLSQGMVALVDDADFERLNQFKWCASKESRGTKHYAIRWITLEGRRVKVRMHREVLGLPVVYCGGLVGDHLNHDGLDNQRANLEAISQEENMRRSLGWKKCKSNCSI